MSMVKTRRAAVVEQVEELGVVAVIRFKDPAKLRAVVDALADGGVRALEVTMTVPGAVELIRELAPTLPAGFLLGAGTVTDAGDGARGDRRRRDVRGRTGVPAGRRSPRATSATWRRCRAASRRPRFSRRTSCGADIVKVFPATSLGPQFIKDVRAPLPQVKLMPTGGVTLDNARRLDSRRRRRGRDRVGVARRQGDRRRPLRRDYGQCTARRGQRRVREIVSPTTDDTHRRHLRRNHAASQPTGVRALLPVARAVGDLRRRRSERRGQPRALRAAPAAT